jgi:prepilin-type N-terminal cleavage/methylation domain-containing protein
MTPARPASSPPRGISLVEVLVVVAIIGLLVALLLPAVQSAREAGRRTTCIVNLRQLALASLAHEQAHGFLPTGGWGGAWTGDPDRGFGIRQPGGWAFNVLPFMEQATLRDLGSGLTDAEAKGEAAVARLQTPLPLFTCPTRRGATLWPLDAGKNTRPLNVVAVPADVVRRPDKVARGDYAANMGSGTFPANRYRSGGSPATAADGDTWSDAAWQAAYGPPTDGLVFRRSRVRLKEITDGVSGTYLVGEKYVNPAGMSAGRSDDDDQCLFSGHDRDVLRVGLGPPCQDRAGFEPTSISFGSSHPGSCGMALADGSVTAVAYDVDATVFQARASRNDAAR